MLGMWSFTAETSQHGLFSAPAAGISAGRSDAVSSLGSTRWSPRISRTSGVWSLAGMNKTKPLCEVTQSLRDFNHSGGRSRNSCDAWRGGRWTIGRRIEVTADIEDLESVAAIPKEPTGPSPDRRLSGRDERCGVSEETCALSWLHGRRICTFEVASGKVTGREKDGDTFRSKWGRGTSAEPPMTSRVSGHSTRSRGRTHWQARRCRSQWDRAHSEAVQFGPCYIGETRCPSKIERPNATRSSHSAGSRWEEQSHLFHWKAIPRTHQKPMRLPADLSEPCRRTCRAGFGRGQVQKQPFIERKVRCKSRNGVNGSAIHRGPHRKGSSGWATSLHAQRILRTRHECLGIVTAAHEKKVRKDLMTLLKEYWIRLQLLCGHLRTLRRVVAMVARLLRRGQERESLQQPPRRQLEKAGSCRSETCRSSRTAGTGRQGRKNQGRRGRDWAASVMMLAQVSFAVVHAASRQIRAGGLCSLH